MLIIDLNFRRKVIDTLNINEKPFKNHGESTNNKFFKITKIPYYYVYKTNVLQGLFFESI